MGVDDILWAEAFQASSSQSEKERAQKFKRGAIGRPWDSPKTKGDQGKGI